MENNIIINDNTRINSVSRTHNSKPTFAPPCTHILSILPPWLNQVILFYILETNWSIIICALFEVGLRPKSTAPSCCQGALRATELVSSRAGWCLCSLSPAPGGWKSKPWSASSQLLYSFKHTIPKHTVPCHGTGWHVAIFTPQARRAIRHFESLLWRWQPRLDHFQSLIKVSSRWIQSIALRMLQPRTDFLFQYDCHFRRTALPRRRNANSRTCEVSLNGRQTKFMVFKWIEMWIRLGECIWSSRCYITGSFTSR